MKSSSRLLRVLFGLKVLLIYHIIVINCAPKDRGTSESSRVESWINYLLSETGISSHSLGRYFGLKGTVHIARMGPTSSKLNGRKYVGFVPWAKQFDMDIDGIYEIEGDMIFKKLSSHEHNKIEDNEDKHEEDNTKTKTIIKFLHHENSFRFEERDSESSDLIREKEVEVFGALGPFTLYQCSMGRLNIIWDKEEKVEIARLLCVNSIRLTSFGGYASACLRYASGLVTTIKSFYNSFELVGERQLMHAGKCTDEDLQENEDVYSKGELPFNIHIQASYTYEPNSLAAEYDISGEYKLDLSLGRSYWYKLDKNGSSRPDIYNRLYYFDYYWDRLNVVDASSNSTLKTFYVPEDNALIWSRCLRGLHSSLWDVDESREVARIWCGPRDTSFNRQKTDEACWRYPAGRYQSFPNELAVTDMKIFFPDMQLVHKGECTIKELGSFAEALGIPVSRVILVVVGTCVLCGFIAGGIIVASFLCCYSRIVPISRKRAAGFRPLGKGGAGEEDEEMEEEKRIAKTNRLNKYIVADEGGNEGDEFDDGLKVPGILIHDSSPRYSGR